jgi:hypothetical protein
MDFGFSSVPEFTIEERPEMEIATNFGVHLRNPEANVV